MNISNRINKERQQELLEALYAMKKAPKLHTGICTQIVNPKSYAFSMDKYRVLKSTLKTVLGPQEYHIRVPESRMSMESQYSMVLGSITWEYTNQFILKRMELLNSLIYTLEDSLGIVG